jgi:hypothetical protein
LVTTHRFPAAWSAEVQLNYYVVRDADGQAERCLFKLLPQKALTSDSYVVDGLSDRSSAARLPIDPYQ